MEDKQTTLNTIIGMGLIFILVYLWMQYSAPPQAQPKPSEPSPAASNTLGGSGKAQENSSSAVVSSGATDSSTLASRYGVFAPAAVGRDQRLTLENDLVRITFANKGGFIEEVFLKKYYRSRPDSTGKLVKSPVRLLANPNNRFEYLLSAVGSSSRISTADLYFEPKKEGQTIIFRAPTTTGGYLEQRYTLRENSYELDYRVRVSQPNEVLAPGQDTLYLRWVNHLDKMEPNEDYERTMSTVYYKPEDNSPDYCDCRSDDTETLGERPVRWFSHANQFFNTSLIARDFTFSEFVGETVMRTSADSVLKTLRTSARVPIRDGEVHMTILAGPSEFELLRSYGLSLEDIIPFGASIFGAINRWVIHPLFDLLARFIGNAGIIILTLTLIVKLLLFPLTYRIVYSQAKMAALKPKIDELRKKYGNDQQTLSIETMKLYSEFKVNPLGGCLPVLLQMPIWFALYRFFPAAIEFRQAGFLWATDLSSYDVAVRLPFHIWGLGSHLSAFTLIWVVTTLWYTWYSFRQMDTATLSNPEQMLVMKYMQYAMPIVFLFFFNTFASGLTLYLCFSNLLNIGQTFFTKAFLIDHEKIKAQLEANKNRPRKPGGFRERLEAMMREQQRLREEQAKREQQRRKKAS
ncbi:MAG: membrane protein insertase YidC [Saprospiraceae bacterium]|nr:membrane protein insertase YidC [Saprospiraceae bacterium]MDW8482797.1 membrane protein insertase YidC [Saprospiraceae bacterium]